STNHFMGPGYWAWVIPLANQKTSIGIVADDALHPFDTLRTQEAAAEWLERHEPQLAERVGSAPRLDFLVMRDYSHSCRRVFDAEARWAITGEAGYFTDPLYSPGSDFIALANDLITDLIVRDHAGLEIEDRAQHHARTYASTYRAVMSIYEGQYPIMGSPRAMTMKILWDFTMYWSSIALVYRQGGFVDPDVMMRVRPMLLELAELGKEMQDFFRAWATLDGSAALSGFVDYSSIPFLERLNRDLLSSMCEEEWVARLATNISFLHELGTEIRARVSLMHPELGPSERPGTTHVASTFATLFDEANVDRHASA
ncbi:MAG: halogenase, partial [Sandaracinaceae bacterium]